MFLKVKNLIKIYDNKKVLNDINFELEKGKILCILGPSGCGKTTILNSIGGFVKVSNGNIILDNIDITNLEPEKRKVATVFQSYGLFNHKNVFENVEYGLKFRKINKKMRKEKVEEILNIVGLKGYEKREIHELSGGQQQRVALARSIVINPSLILLDEPFSNLDENLKDMMRKELKRLVNYFEMTAIIVTHDQEDAFTIADKVILMSDGKIIQNDTPVNLYNNPNSEFTMNFIGKSNKWSKNEYIRPEKIKILEYDIKYGNDNNYKKGKIKNIIFKGTVIEYVVELENGKELNVLELNNENKWKKDEDVMIYFEKNEIK